MYELNDFTFKGEGHQQHGRQASNLFVNFVQIPPQPGQKDFGVQSRYSRNKQDLFFRKKISLQEAINCVPMKIPTLDGRQLLLPIDQVITPKTIKKIEGEGLVYYDRNDYLDERQKRGDLYVSFEIVFPSKLDNEQKAKIEELLMA